MKENLNKQKKQLRELSEEELQNVTGGIGRPSDIGVEVKVGGACVIQSCPPGCKLDTSLQPCQCVPVPNTVPHRN